MKFAVITDIHFGARNDSRIIMDAQQRFFNEIFFPYLEEHDIKTVINLGDTFDRRKYINYITLKQSKDMFFDRLENRGIEMLMVLGNHDVYYKDTNEVNSVEELVIHYPNIEIITNDPYEIFLKNSRNEKAILVPWITRSNEDVIKNRLVETDAKVCMGHFEIDGYEVSSGNTHKGGMSASLFTKFQDVYSGHFHTPSSKGNITYLGAPYPMNWGDVDGRQRGFHIFDTETLEMELIGNPHSAFKPFYYDDRGIQIESLSDQDFSDYTNSYVRVIIKHKENPYTFDLLMEKIQNVGVANIKVLDETLMYDIDEDLSVGDIENTHDIMVNYIDKSSTNIDKELIKDFVNDLYTRALTYDSVQDD